MEAVMLGMLSKFFIKKHSWREVTPCCPECRIRYRMRIRDDKERVAYMYLVQGCACHDGENLEEKVITVC